MNLLKHVFRAHKVDFSEKVRYRMKYDRNPLLIMLQDKYLVRNYAISKRVNTAKLLYVSDKVETIPFEQLPSKYLIKMNHGRKWNILGFNSKFYLFEDGKKLVKEDGTFINIENASQYEMTQSEVIEKCKTWLTQKYRETEWAYQHILPKLLIEELLESKDGKALKDYRMYTFHGKVRAISVGSAIYRRECKNIFLGTDWDEIKLSKYKEALPNPFPERPENLEELIDVAERLGEDIDFARFDLYDSSQGVVMGEVTIYPNAGSRYYPTACPVFNKWLGDQWDLEMTKSADTFFEDVIFELRKIPRYIRLRHF